MGRRQQFDRAFAEHFDAIHGFMQRRLGRELADDLAAETFAVALRQWRQVDLSRPVRPWLYGIAANLIRRHYRDEQRKLRAYARTGVDPAVETSEEEVTERATAQAQRRALAQALAELRREEREVLLLFAWAELTDAEIAAALGLPLGTVKSRLSRARERLRNRLAEIGQSVDERGEEEQT